jgi:uncharacterized phage protein gp47/JayE
MASLASLILQETKQAIYARGLAVAQALGLPVTSWIAGDPTRSLYWYLAEVLSTLEVMVAGYVASGFLDYATGDWLTVLAKQVYNVDRVEATYASTSVTLTNTGGGLYVIAPGDVVVKDTATGKTYTNTSGGTLASGAGHTLALDFVADESGSGSNAAASAIDTLVTGMLGVTCTNATAAVASDAESDPDLRQRCRDKLGTLSPNGPRDAYDYVVRTSSLTNSLEITRSRTIADSNTGNVTVYVAGSSGAVTGAAVTAAQSAVQLWATPLCITPTVANCTSTAIDVTYELWMYASVGVDVPTIEAAVQAALTSMFAARPIGGDIIPPSATGALYQSLIASTIRGVYSNDAFRVSVTAPSGDTALAINAVPALGTVTPTVHIEANP